MAGVFHPGEEEVQRRAGVFETAARLGPRMVQPEIDDDFADFLAERIWVVLASATPDGTVWTSVLYGPPGFAAATSPTHLALNTGLDADDPLSEALAAGPAPVGLLALEPMTRGRIRLNGLARRTPDGVEIDLREVFGNCPKYIQRRRPVEVVKLAETPARVGNRLTSDHRQLIGGADTLFLGSRHPERGADASHRGGRPGFVTATEDLITFPDYQGNNMFQSLGNLTADPAAGLLFVDFDSGRTLQVSGQATVVWDEDRVREHKGAQRLVDVRVERIVDRAAGLPLRWAFEEAHRLNP